MGLSRLLISSVTALKQCSVGQSLPHERSECFGYILYVCSLPVRCFALPQNKLSALGRARVVFDQILCLLFLFG